MCRRIDPELQKQFIREVAEELRRWFRKWRRRITATGGLILQRSAPTPTDSPKLLGRLIPVSGTVWQ